MTMLKLILLLAVGLLVSTLFAPAQSHGLIQTYTKRVPLGDSVTWPSVGEVRGLSCVQNGAETICTVAVQQSR